MILISIQKELSAADGKMKLSIELKMAHEEVIGIYGPSGSGKTSVLRMIAGLMVPDAGRIVQGENTLFDSKEKINISPRKRNVGVIFQDYALFPNMSVRENLQFAVDKRNNKSVGKVDQMIDLMDLGQLRDRYPGTLSGGQAQRVALARALVQKPDLLLLDEPLSALDRSMRQKLQDYLLLAKRELGVGMILVSHDPGELVKLSDRVIALESGKVAFDGKPADFFFETSLSGKVQLTGEVIEIARRDAIYVVTVLSGRQLLKVVAADLDIRELKVGDHVLVASKAFNPVIQKLR